MPSFLVLGLLLGAPATPPPGPRAVGIEITVQDRAIELPFLPEGVAQARAAYGPLRPRIETALQDLERDLAGIYAALRPEGPSAAFYLMPSQGTAEGRFLASMLHDESCQTMEEAVLDQWVRWQTLLVRQGLVQPGGSAITSRMVLLAFRRNELRSQDLSDLPWSLFDLLAVDGLDYRGWGSLARGAAALADAQAPQLARSWKPLAQHLNGSALRMLEFERSAAPTQDPALRILRLQARLNVLERFRTALWFCQMVWAHMASERLPAPLKKLGA